MLIKITQQTAALTALTLGSNIATLSLHATQLVVFAEHQDTRDSMAATARLLADVCVSSIWMIKQARESSPSISIHLAFC